MKKFFLFVFIVMAAFSWVLGSDLSESIAIISDYSGSAKIIIEGSLEEKSAEFGMPLHAGDFVETSRGSSAEITFDNATLLKLGPSAKIKLEQIEKKQGSFKLAISLAAGKLHALFRKFSDDDTGAFEIRTKMALAAVKGTDIVIEALDDETGLGVFEGEVEFYGIEENGETGGKQDVKDGNESVAGKKGGKPSDPEALKRFLADKKEIEKLRQRLSKFRSHGREGYLRDMKNERAAGRLKQKARSELNRALKHNRDDSAFVRREQKRDSDTGKTLIDAFGNRVRVEEFVVRPAGLFYEGDITVQMEQGGIYYDNRLDFVNITLRDNRTDLFINSYEFNMPLSYAKPDWRRIWHSYDWEAYQAGNYPNHILSNNRTYKNINTDNTVNQDYSYMVYDFSDWTNLTVDLVLVPDHETLMVNGVYKEMRMFGNCYEYGILNNKKQYKYEMTRDSFYDLTSGDYSETITPFVNNSGFNKLITYDDNSWLSYDYYFLDYTGRAPAGISGPDMFYTDNSGVYFQMVIKASDFTGVPANIDLVSERFNFSLNEYSHPYIFREVSDGIW